MTAPLGRLLVVAMVVVVAAACGTDEGRPSDSAWAPVWEEWRDSIPAAGVLLDRGEGLCDELLGQLHVSRQELLPTPTEGLDAPVHAWITHAQSVTFDCPTGDPEVLRDRLHDLDVLAAEIDAGLAADRIDP